MFCSGCRGKSTDKRQQQDDDNKIEEMEMMTMKRRFGNGFTKRTRSNSEAWGRNRTSRALAKLRHKQAIFNTWRC